MSAIADSKNNDDKNGNEGGGKPIIQTAAMMIIFEQAGRFIIEKQGINRNASENIFHRI